MQKLKRSFITMAILFGVMSSTAAYANSFDWLYGCCNEPYDDCYEQQCDKVVFASQLLIWTAHEDGLAFTNKPSDVLTTTDFTDTTIVHPKYRWDVGFRFVAAYSPSCLPDWTFVGSWANIQNSAQKKREHNSGAPDFEGIFPIRSFDPTTLVGDYVSSARAHWHLNTNIVDLDAVYKYNACWNRLVLTPTIGLRIAVLNQKYDTSYLGGTFSSTSPESNIDRNKFFGIGPRFGTGAEYYLCRGFSLRGFAAAATMYGHYRVKHKEYYLENERFAEGRKKDRFALSFDYAAGLQWKGRALDCLPNVTVGAYWEGHIFFDQNQMKRGEHHFYGKDRDLTLQGITLSASFAF